MIDPLLAFSHHYCVAICAVLVPANLLATLGTLILVGVYPSHGRIRGAAILASLLALVMVLHVYSWLLVGIVMPPTFILLTLGSVCLALNTWSLAHLPSLRIILVGVARAVAWGRNQTQTTLIPPGI